MKRKEEREMEAECRKAENYDHTADWNVMTYVDAHDGMNWKAAQITNLSPRTVDVHYESWAPKYDESKVSKSSKKLAPFRRHSVGYTGQTRQAYRDFRYNKSEKLKYEAVLKSLIESRLETGMSPVEFTQLMRGDLFFFVDSLLTLMHHCQATESEIQEAFAFMEVVFEFVVNYIVVFPKFLQEYRLICKYPLLYLVDTRAAVAASYPEWAAILTLALGAMEGRVNQTHQHIKAKMPELLSVSQLYYGMLAKKAGIDAILTMVCTQAYPLRMVAEFFPALLKATQYDLLFREKYLGTIARSLEKRFREFNIEDMEDLELIGAGTFVGYVDSLLHGSAVGLNCSVVIKRQIEAMRVLYYFSSRSPAMKLKGLGLLRSQYPALAKLDTAGAIASDQVQTIIAALKEVKFVSSVFGPDTSAEVVSKAREIVKFLITQNSFTLEDMHGVWECFAKAGSGEQKLEVLNLIAEMAEYAPFPIVEFFFRLFRKIPLASYTLGTTKFLSKYLKGVGKNIGKRMEAMKKSGEKPADQYELYDYDLLWRLMVDDKIAEDLRRSAMESLIECTTNCPELQNHYLIASIHMIEADAPAILTVIQFFKLVHLQLQPRDKARESLIAACKGHGLFLNVFKLLMGYLEWVRNQDKSGVKPMEFEFKMGIKHGDYVRGVFDLLDFISDYSEGQVALLSEHLDQLWSRFVLEPLCEEESNIFYLMLTRSKVDPKGDKRTYTFINDYNCVELFANCFLKESKFRPQSLSLVSYNCFHSYFLRYNQLRKHIRMEKGKIVILTGETEGMQVFWSTSFNCSETQVRENAIKFVLSVYCSMYYSKKASLPEITYTVACRALECSLLDFNNSEKISIMLSILSQLLSEFEDTSYEKINKEQYKSGMYTIRKCRVTRGDVRDTKDLNIKIQDSMNIKDLKYAISYYVKVPVSRIKLLVASNKQLVDESKNQILIRNANVDFIAEIAKSSIPSNQSPAYTLSNNPRCKLGLIQHIEISAENAGRIWKMLKSFPLNEKMIERILSLTLQPKAPFILCWCQYLGIDESVANMLDVFYHFKCVLHKKKLQSAVPPDFAVSLSRKKGCHMVVHNYNRICPTFKPSIIHMKLVKYMQQSLCALLQQIPVEMVFEDKNEAQDTVLNAAGLLAANIDGRTSGELNLPLCKMLKSGFKMIHLLGSVLGVKAVDKDNLLSTLLIQYYRRCSNYSLMKMMTSCLWKHMQRNDRNKEYNRFLVFVLFHKVLDFPDIMPSFTPNYFIILKKLIEICTEECLQVETLVEKKSMEKLCDFLVDFEKYPGVNLGGISDVIGALYHKYRFKFRSSLPHIELMSRTLLLFVLPDSKRDLSEEKQRMLREAVRNPGLGRSALNLLRIVGYGNGAIIGNIAREFLSYMLHNTDWRMDVGWEVLIESSRVVESNRFVGLINPANICYMNSLLQLLFRVKPFIQEVMGSKCKGDAGESLTHGLKLVFGIMDERLHRVYDASFLCELIQDFEGNALDIAQQKDIDEFLGLLVNRMEEDAEAGAFRSAFEGAYANETISLECPHRSERIENFLTLNVDIHDRRSLAESLSAMVSGEMLTGENLYFCERCERKMKARRRTTLKFLPNYLAISLNRFRFDPSTGSRKKLNDFFEFPMEINLQECSAEYQLSKERGKVEKLSMLPSSYYSYKLTGVVLHCGSAQSGHYTCFIHDVQSEDWFEFNDKQVSRIDPALIPDEAFGGQEEAKGFLTGFSSGHEMFEKIKNAYMLLYERAEGFNMEKVKRVFGSISRRLESDIILDEFNSNSVAHDSMVLEKIKKNAISGIEVDKETVERVMSEYWRSSFRHSVISGEFVSLITNIVLSYRDTDLRQFNNYDQCRRLNLQEDLPAELLEYSCHFTTWKFLASSVLNIVLRTKLEQGEALYCVLRVFKKVIRRDLCFAMYVAETLGNYDSLSEFFLNCPTLFPKFFFSSCLLSALKVLLPHEHKMIDKVVESEEEFNKFIDAVEISSELHSSPIILLAVNNVLALFSRSLRNEPMLGDVCYLLSLISRVSPSLRGFMLRHGVVGMLFKIVSNDQSTPAKCIAHVTLHKKNYGLNTGRRRTVKSTQIEKPENKGDMRFVIDLLAQVFTSCQLSPESHPKLKYKLATKECENLSQFYFDEFLARLFLHSNNNVARDGICRILQHCCVSNPELSLKLIQFLIITIAHSDLPSLPSFLLALEHVMSIPDQYAKERWEAFMPYFKDLMGRMLAESYIPYNLVCDSFIKLACKCPELASKIHKEGDKLGFVKKWLERQTFPAPGYVHYLKTTQNKREVQKALDSKDKQMCKDYSRARAKVLESFEKTGKPPAGEPPFAGEEYHNLMNEEFVEEQALNSFLDVCVDGEWLIGRVAGSVEEAVDVAYLRSGEKAEHEWIPVWSDSLAPFPSRTGSESSKFYHRLLLLATPAQS